MARALRSSGASASASTSPATTNGTATRARLKRKRTADDDQQQGSPKHAPRRDDDDDSASPLTDLAPSPAVKHEHDDGTPNGDLQTPNTTHTPLPDAPHTPKEDTRSPTPYAFIDRCDVPLDPQDAHKLLTVLEMFDTQSLLARHVPSGDVSLRAMLKNPANSFRTIRAAVASLAPPQTHSRARPSLEVTAQRSFCELALGLLDEVAQKQGISKDRTSVYQVSAGHKSTHGLGDLKPVRYALQQTIHRTDYYTSISDDALTPEKAASLATGQANLIAVIPSIAIPATAMPTLGSYTRKPQTYISPPQPPVYTLPSLLELSYGTRTSFAPTYDSGSSAVTRSAVDGIVARRMKAGRALGPPPVLGGEARRDKDSDMDMSDGATQLKPTPSIHPDLVLVIDPALVPAPESTSPTTPGVVSKLDPTLDPDTTSALEAAFQELALEESVRGLLDSNARAMTTLVDMQNERLQRWDSRKPDLGVLDGKGEELELAACIEKTLCMLASLRPRTILDALSPVSTNPPLSAQTSIIPPATTLRAVHRTLPTEPSPGYRGTLDPRDPRGEMALRDNTTIKVGNVSVPVPPAVPVPAPATPVGGAVRPLAGGVRPAYAATPTSGYYAQAGGQYPQAQLQATYPQAGQYGQAPAGQYPTPGQYPMQYAQAQYGAYQGAQYPGAGVGQQGQYAAGAQQGQYATGQYPPAGQQGQYPPAAAQQGQQYPFPYQYNPAAQAAGASGYPGAVQGATYPNPAQPGAYPAVQGATYPNPAQAGAYPAPTQAGAYPAPTQAGAYPTPGQATVYPTPGQANSNTPRVITNVVKPAAQGVWSPGQGYTPGGAGGYTPTAAAGYTPGAGGGYTPTAGAGYTPGAAYSPAVGQGYTPVATPGQAYPASAASGSYTPTAAYAPTPVKPGARGPIPPHVMSTPGTPASPSTYLPSATPVAANPGAAAGYAWNGGAGTPTPGARTM
ncbi:hypothetical protein BDV93DRAFT_517355 [Ceratobasidium sp. AG-I]|nr:hypothetical protein BDV93DRAFT_517355 [Ceratobasidium sp. AG-I]